MSELVSVVIVTYNSEIDIAECLVSIGRQTYTPIETLVIDNDSDDATLAVIDASVIPVRLVKNAKNQGFAAAHNQGIRLTRGKFYLALNPDVVMPERFIEELVRGMEVAPTVGAVTGKLLRMVEEQGPRRIDTTGIYMTPSLRHLDRGAGEPDLGQYERPQFVFGASGAAALYRRRMLEEVATKESISTRISLPIGKMPTSLGVPNSSNGERSMLLAPSPHIGVELFPSDAEACPPSSTCTR